MNAIFFFSFLWDKNVHSYTNQKKNTPETVESKWKNNTILVVIQEKVDSILVVCALRTLHVEDVESRA